MKTTDEILKTKKTDLLLVDPNNISIENGFNIRQDMGDILGLSLSIIQLGIIEPLEAYKVRGEDKYVLTDGHRRIKAVEMAFQKNAEGDKLFSDLEKIKYIPVKLSSSEKKDRLYIMAVTGEGKKQFTPLEKANMYQVLIDMAVEDGKKKGDAVKEISGKLGVSVAQIYNTLSLNEVDEEVKDLVASGKVSGTAVVEVSRQVKNKERQKEIIKKAVNKTNGKVTSADIEEIDTLKISIKRLEEIYNGCYHFDEIKKKTIEIILNGLKEKKSVNEIVESISNF